MKAGILIGHMLRNNECSLIRTAEAFGINLVFRIGNHYPFYSVSQGADKHVVFFDFNDYYEFLEYTKRNNHSIVCIENVDCAIELTSVRKYPNNPIFITGNESKGVPEILLNNARLIVSVEQGGGYIPCLNTTIAASIILHDFYVKQIRFASKK